MRGSARFQLRSVAFGAGDGGGRTAGLQLEGDALVHEFHLAQGEINDESGEAKGDGHIGDDAEQGKAKEGEVKGQHGT